MQRPIAFQLLLWIVAAGFAFGGQPGFSQQATPPSSTENVVHVLAIVHDKKGEVVRTLGKDDFTLEQDGRPQTISDFRQTGDVPLTLGLLVDTDAGQRNAIEPERGASYKFLDQTLRDRDVAFLIHFDREVELLQDVTASRDKLQKGLDSLQTTQLRQADSSGEDPNSGSPGGHRRGTGRGATLYDAVFLSADELLAKPQGRKALVILGDGVDRGSKVTLERAIESAQRSHTIVYTIYMPGEGPQENRRMAGSGRTSGGIGFPGGGYPGGYPGGGYPGGGYPGGQQKPEPRVDGKKILEDISTETGGRMFEVSKKLSLDRIYSQIEEELRSQYSLGFTPDKADPGYHKIRVETKSKDLKAQAPAGYYSD